LSEFYAARLTLYFLSSLYIYANVRTLIFELLFAYIDRDDFMTALLLILHLISAVIWVGGMFFAYVCLRPVAATLLEPNVRLPLWCSVFKRFFPWVWLSVLVIILSGHGMISMFGGMGGVGKHVHIMMGLGYLMIGLYLHVYFALFGKLKLFVVAESWAEAGTTLNKIRIIIGVNLLLGLFVIAMASGGRYLFV